MTIKTINISGRFRLFYDTNHVHYRFMTTWDNNGNSQSRTVTEEEAEILQRILMGGFIKDSVQLADGK